jgi:hypothetical protein
MRYLAILLWLFSNSAMPEDLSFSDSQCLNASFQTKIEHKGSPFGLFKNILDIKKEQCHITIDQYTMKVLHSHWSIDVCRHPVHIKEGDDEVDILKRISDCKTPTKAEAEYCSQMNEILRVIQDDGLIFAEGEKEKIDSDHGRVYCTYLILQTYLISGNVLNRFYDYEQVLPRVENKFKKAAMVVKPSVVPVPSH